MKMITRAMTCVFFLLHRCLNSITFIRLTEPHSFQVLMIKHNLMEVWSISFKSRTGNRSWLLNVPIMFQLLHGLPLPKLCGYCLQTDHLPFKTLSSTELLEATRFTSVSSIRVYTDTRWTNLTLSPVRPELMKDPRDDSGCLRTSKWNDRAMLPIEINGTCKKR